MRLTPDVDIPESLLEAAANGDLVLFVGAGASYNAPSSLPLFSGLASRIGQLHDDPYDEGEPADAYLGRLEDLHASVREQVRRIIQPSTSAPNSTHKAIAQLASACKTPKVVTTNFDEHVTTAARELACDIGEQYNAPAVPLGRSFRGLVHLHGAVSRDAQDLVFTDADFGRAYLTDGWARRFVQDLFLNNTVLFIGYSHDDTVMKYLARGLPPQTRRFAFTTESDTSKWANLGISPIPYPPAEQHAALPEALSAWARYLNQGLLDQRERIIDIITSGPPKLPVDADYLTSALMQPVGVRTFAEHARGTDWLTWAESKQSFRSLFEFHETESDHRRELSAWFVDNYLSQGDFFEEGLRTLARLGPGASSELADAIAFGAMRSRHEPNLVKRLSLLGLSWIETSPAAGFRSRSNFYNTELRGSDLLLFFRALLDSRLQMAENRPWFSDESDGEISTPVTVTTRWVGAQADIDALWAAIQSQDVELDYSLLQIAEQAVRQRYELVAAFRENPFDSLSFRRSAIEPHQQDQHRDEDSAIIDILRDAAENHLAEDPFTAQRWLESDIPILKRIGVHLITENPKLAPSKKLQVILDHNLLYSYHAKHEVFRLLRQVAPRLGDTERNDLLAAIQTAPAGPHVDVDQQLRQRVVFDRLEWLAREVSGWPELDTAIAAIRADRPEIGTREHPDLDHYMTSGSWGGKQPWTVPEYLSLIDNEGVHSAAKQLIERDYSEHDFEEPDWDSALNLLSQVVEARPTLALQLVDTPGVREAASSQQLLAAIIRGLAKAGFDDLVRADAISIATRYASNGELALSIASLVLAIIKADVDLPTVDRNALDSLATELWTRHSEAFQNPDTDDWLSIGLNSWPGYLAQYWLERISRRVKKDRPDIPSLAPEEAQAIRLFLAEHGPAGHGPLALICNELYFLFAIDADFTIAQLFPLFQPGSSGVAVRAWHAYLYSPRISSAMLDAGLWESLIAMAGNELVADNVRLRSQFWDLLSAVLLRPGQSERRELAIDAVTRVGSGATEDLFSHLAYRLNDLDAEDQQAAWDSWIAPIRAHRLDRLPGQETPAEASAWCDLFLRMRHVLPDGLSMGLKAPGALTSKTTVMDLDDQDFRLHGGALAKLFEERVRATPVIDGHLEWTLRELVEKLREQGADAESLRALVEACLQAGVHRATTWFD